MDPLACVFCLQEAHLYLLQFTMALAGRVVWDSEHQSSQQAQQQPAAGIEERSYRWKQQNVKMLDCRPALGGGREVGAWNAPKVSRPVEKGCEERLRASHTEPMEHLAFSPCVNKIWGTIDSPGLKSAHPNIPMSTSASWQDD